jgi:hypothetical protein
LLGGYAGVLAQNRKTLYFAEWGEAPSTGAVLVFRVSPTTGSFSQLTGKPGCLTTEGSSNKGAGTCEKARAIDSAYQIAIASRGRLAYVASNVDNGVTVFHVTG